jgi:hypothetical protein
LGVVFLIAFTSLAVQIEGLVGSQGILPVERFLRNVEEFAPEEAILIAPTLCWLDPRDRLLNLHCAGGIVLSVLLILNVASGPVIVLLWAGYLSLSVAGQDFLSFQWDALLLETGFLAVFLAPWRLRPRFSGEGEPPKIPLFLLRWLLFRLMLLSGVVKLASEDPVWHDLTALQYHWWTQPIPSPFAPAVHDLPEWTQKVFCGGMFAIELAVPIFIFGPRLYRRIAFWAFTLLMTAISLTGNYGFFNLLTFALCILLLDDRSLRRILPARLRSRFDALPPRRPLSLVRRGGLVGHAVLILLVVPATTLVAVQRVWRETALPDPVREALGYAASFRTFNAYGLFADMTTERQEILIEGSADGRAWKEYGFRWKPQDPARLPPWVAPHMPRLDWKMWFAALSPAQFNRWFFDLEHRLLEGSPSVLDLLAENPFPEEPPRYVRAVLYDYRFATAEERRRDGSVWHRERRGLYTPALTLQGGRLALAGH